MTLTRLLIFAAVSGGAALALGLVYLIWRAGLHWSGLIVDDATGKVSGTKLSALFGFAAVTTIFLRAGWNTAPSDGLSLMILVYYGLATSSQFASKLVGARFGGGIATTPGTEKTTEKTTEKETVRTAPVIATGPVATTESAVNQRTGGDDVPKA